MPHLRTHTVRLITGLTLFIGLPAVEGIVGDTETDQYVFEVPADRGIESIDVTMDLSMGNILIGRAERDFLFQAEVALENEKLKPTFEFDADGSEAELDVGLTTKKNENVGITSLSSIKSSEWLLYLTDSVPLDIDLAISAAKAEVDLTGLKVRQLDLELGASRSVLRFNRLNGIEMEMLDIEAGASEFQAYGLGNTRAKVISFEGGIGKFLLDFGTDARLLRDRQVHIETGVASTTIFVPKAANVVLNAPDSWGMSLDMPRAFKKDDAGNWRNSSSEANAFQIFITSSIGKVQVVEK
ncbi:MAG: toast rack family protein [Bacteroidota bacterium]